MKTLIVGVNGFTGLHLFRHLQNNKAEKVAGTYHRKLDSFKKGILKGCACFPCDVLKARQVRDVLKKVKPSCIYYLPAIVTVARSFEVAEEIYRTNIIGAVNFFKACLEVSPHSRILLAGSAEEYGKVSKKDLPIKEHQALCPVSPYGLSKAAQEMLAAYYALRSGLEVVTARTFHFAGPFQPDSFVISDFARQIAEIENGLRKPMISVGNLKAKRDFTDIRDVVRAYGLLMRRAPGGEVFNVCSGKSSSIEYILNLLLSKARVRITVQIDPRKVRKLDVPDFRGDNSRLVSLTGWRPQISIDTTVGDVLNWWRGHIESKKTNRRNQK